MSTFVIGAVMVLVGLMAPSLRARRHNRLARDAVRRGNRTTPGRPAGTAGEAIWIRIVRRVGPRRRPRALAAQELAAMLDGIARRCASGHSLRTAFVTTAAAFSNDGPFTRTDAALRMGATVDQALAHEQPGHPDHRLAVHVLRLCAQQGGNVSESLDRAAATLRERHAANQERVAQAAQARLSAKVLTVVPMAFASWTVATTASVQRFMITPGGLVCAATGVGLNLIGWSLMNRAIRGTA